MMKPIACRLIPGFCALLLAFGAGAHPHDSPLTFIPHLNDNGAIIFTNIPKKCFRNGVLICTRYHPLLSQQQDSSLANP